MKNKIIEKGLRDLRASNEHIFWAYITRDGIVLEEDLPHDVHHETFAIMNATILGAAHTLNSEFPEGEVERVVVEAGRYRIVVLGLDKDTLISLVVPRNLDLSALLVYLHKVKTSADHVRVSEE